MGDPELSVSGGAGGLSAHYDDLELLAKYSDADGAVFAGLSARGHAILADPDVVASAVLDPPGMVAFAEALLGALEGLSGLSAQLLARGGALRTVSLSYQAADEAERGLLDGARFLVGYELGHHPGLLAVLAANGYLVYRMASAVGVRIDWQRLLTEHPGLVDDAVGAAPGLLDGLPGPDPVSGVASAARLIARLYPDGQPVVTDLGVDTGDPSMTRPPAGYADLVAGLSYRDNQSNGAHQGEIDVRVVTRPDGSRAYIVDLPGTKDRHLEPGPHPGPLNDMGTNFHAIAGEPTSYEAGVAEALRRAGAGATDPVMLVGHSQGGIVAADAAHDFVVSGQFNVTHVVTLGAPVGRIEVPATVAMLSVENRDDIVPHLDAAANPDTANRTTVSFTRDTGNVGLNHDLATSYLPAARTLDGSTAASVTQFRTSAAAFFDAADGTALTTHAYQVTRS